MNEPTKEQIAAAMRAYADGDDMIAVCLEEEAMQRALRAAFGVKGEDTPAIGDYVLVTKFHDGDFGDPWAVGFYAGMNGDRHLVNGSEGLPIRANGWRRVGKVSDSLGRWLLANSDSLERTAPSPEVFNLWMLVDAISGRTNHESAIRADERKRVVDAIKSEINKRGGWLKEWDTAGVLMAINEVVDKLAEDVAHELDVCPNCGGDADNGFSRDVPPAPYYCTKCMKEEG